MSGFVGLRARKRKRNLFLSLIFIIFIAIIIIIYPRIDYEIDTIVPNDYMLRNDKIFMNEGIETRVPLLDLNIVNKILMVNESRKFRYRFKQRHCI